MGWYFLQVLTANFEHEFLNFLAKPIPKWSYFSASLPFVYKITLHLRYTNVREQIQVGAIFLSFRYLQFSFVPTSHPNCSNTRLPVFFRHRFLDLLCRITWIHRYQDVFQSAELEYNEQYSRQVHLKNDDFQKTFPQPFSSGLFSNYLFRSKLSV